MLRVLEPQWGGSRTDPLSALIETWAAREYGNRQRVNVRMRRNMLPYATELDLDIIGVLLTVARRPDETDASYRVRLSDQFAANSPAVKQFLDSRNQGGIGYALGVRAFGGVGQHVNTGVLVGFNDDVHIKHLHKGVHNLSLIHI